MICATTNEASMYVRRDVANLPEVQQGYYGVTVYSKVVSANGQLAVESPTSLDDQDGGPLFGSSAWDGDAATSNGTPKPGSGSYSTSWQGSGSGRNIAEKRPGTVLGVYLWGGVESITPDGIGPFLPPGTCVAFDDLQVTFTAASQ